MGVPAGQAGLSCSMSATANSWRRKEHHNCCCAICGCRIDPLKPRQFVEPSMPGSIARARMRNERHPEECSPDPPRRVTQHAQARCQHSEAFDRRSLSEPDLRHQPRDSSAQLVPAPPPPYVAEPDFRKHAEGCPTIPEHSEGESRPTVRHRHSSLKAVAKGIMGANIMAHSADHIKHVQAQQARHHLAVGEMGSVLGMRLQAKELERLPPAVALRQVLIECAGSLLKAYRVMDINKSGKVTFNDFKCGLQMVGAFRSPLFNVWAPDMIWQALLEEAGSCHHDMLELEEVLGFVPPRHDHTHDDVFHPCDTNSMWVQYTNATSAMRNSLAREPRWRANTAATDRPEVPPEKPEGHGGATGAAASSTTSGSRKNCKSTNRSSSKDPPPEAHKLTMDHLKRHQNLQQILEQARRASRNDKLQLHAHAAESAHVISRDKLEHKVAKENLAQARRSQRIAGAIHDCAHARHELAAMTHNMAMVVRASQLHQEGLSVRMSVKGDVGP
eukprot:gnl/TRDRNA2_/TRDRNA2_188401_c0_seq1.p1 gnl/TRDRNA2_/TRDRNA2_188401_c0~~gnl/TRDRNA2_/TRDRNA2_188401_c0_seq1.p1  ORF type:complete len:502 (-),score=64.36 gnl/TRDRNA2_/TRDRNA2_188401_c0_seq1:31-1536(-)